MSMIDLNDKSTFDLNLRTIVIITWRDGTCYGLHPNQVASVHPEIWGKISDQFGINTTIFVNE